MAEEGDTIHLSAALENAGEITRGREPAAVSELLDAYKTVLADAIEAQQGFCVAALADQLAASWGGISSQTPRDSAVHACRAALSAVKALAADSKLGVLGLRLNIGIARDEDLALELRRLCRDAGASVLVGESARALCAEALSFQEAPTLRDSTGKPLKAYRLK